MVANLYKLRQGPDKLSTCVFWAMIGHSPGYQASASVVIGWQQLNDVAPRHRITLLLGNFAGTANIANKQCVYKWNVGVRFEGNEERNLKVINKMLANCYHNSLSLKLSFAPVGLALPSTYTN